MQELRRVRNEEGVALVEFAVTLPLMVVMVIGIFDFGGAFNLKQKLYNAAEAGARFGATLPTSDLSNGSCNGGGSAPCSVISVRNVVDDYLTAEEVNDCGLLRTGGSPSGGMEWTFQSSGNGCPPLTFSLSIERGFASTGGGVNAVTTRVIMSYPYAWRFGHVIGLLTPGRTFTGTSLIKAEAIVPNMN